MNIFICLDDKNGMIFNGRRQSRDSQVRKKMLDISDGSRLLMNGYSAKQFEENDNITVSEQFLQDAQADDFCFVEDTLFDLDKAQSIYVFRWNRLYPSDMTFDADLSESGFELASTEEFAGSSHDKITLEFFERR